MRSNQKQKQKQMQKANSPTAPEIYVSTKRCLAGVALTGIADLSSERGATCRLNGMYGLRSFSANIVL